MLSTESRMRGDMQVRFGGRYGKTYCRKAVRRPVPSLRIVLLLCLLLSLVLSAVVRLFLPSEIVGMMLQQLLPWMVAAVAGYGFTAWICIEPQWKQRMLCIVVSVGLLSMLFVSSYPGAYSQFGAGICWILAASFIFPFSSCIRFKYGVQ